VRRRRRLRHLELVAAELALTLAPSHRLTARADLSFVLTTGFVWRVALIVAISAAPLWVLKYLKAKFAPTQYAKLRDF